MKYIVSLLVVCAVSLQAQNSQYTNALNKNYYSKLAKFLQAMETKHKGTAYVVRSMAVELANFDQAEIVGQENYFRTESEIVFVVTVEYANTFVQYLAVMDGTSHNVHYARIGGKDDATVEKVGITSYNFIEVTLENSNGSKGKVELMYDNAGSEKLKVSATSKTSNKIVIEKPFK